MTEEQREAAENLHAACGCGCSGKQAKAAFVKIHASRPERIVLIPRAILKSRSGEAYKHAADRRDDHHDPGRDFQAMRRTKHVSASANSCGPTIRRGRKHRRLPSLATKCIAHQHDAPARRS